jgi:arylsulfatase A
MVKRLNMKHLNTPGFARNQAQRNTCRGIRSTTLLSLLLLPLLLGLLASSASAESARPNIIFILIDDLGIDGVGCYGSDDFKDLTPNIDKLARTGLRFETCCSMPLCGPSRFCINSGRYGFRTGSIPNTTAGNKAAQEYPLARLLKEAGYATCMAGKWLHSVEKPDVWGFDEWIGATTTVGWYWEKTYKKNGQDIRLDSEQYMPDVYHDFAMDFLCRKKDGPFFLYYATHLVHTPIVRTPDSTADAKRHYLDNVAYVDKLVGKIADAVDKLGIREKTAIVFTGDNGTAVAAQRYVSNKIGGRKINGAKGSLLEGGVRVPLIVNWKGTTAAGGICQDLVDFSDFYPTFAELAGAPMPRTLVFDGRSFAPQMRGETGCPRDWVFVQSQIFPATPVQFGWYVRERLWKLDNSGRLYDLKDAPFTEPIVAADTKNPETIAARKRLQAILDSLTPADPQVLVPREQYGAEAGQKKNLNKAKKKKT